MTEFDDLNLIRKISALLLDSFDRIAASSKDTIALMIALEQLIAKVRNKNQK